MYKLKKWFYPVFTLLLLVMFTCSVQPAVFAEASKSISSFEDKEFRTDDAATNVQVAETPSLFGFLIRLLISVLVIGGLTIVTMKFLRKNLHPKSGGEFISVFDQYALGVNKGIYIAEVAGQVLVLGVTEQNISVLGTVSDQEIIEEMRTKMLIRQDTLIPTKGLTGYLGNVFGYSSKPIEFKAHIQEQIKKLQTINVNTNQKGKDDEGV